MMTQYKECPVVAPAEYQVDRTFGNVDRANLLAGLVIHEHLPGGDVDVSIVVLRDARASLLGK